MDFSVKIGAFSLTFIFILTVQELSMGQGNSITHLGPIGLAVLTLFIKNSKQFCSSQQLLNKIS